jgi:molybdopterin-binding protein
MTGRDSVFIATLLLRATGGIGTSSLSLRRQVFYGVSHWDGMALSARNRLSGTVDSVTRDGVMAEVVIELPDGQRITSTITRGSADRLELAEGDEVEAVIKASEVMVDKD